MQDRWDVNMGGSPFKCGDSFGDPVMNVRSQVLLYPLVMLEQNHGCSPKIESRKIQEARFYAQAIDATIYFFEYANPFGMLTQIVNLVAIFWP
jgi:hypothetical protein